MTSEGRGILSPVRLPVPPLQRCTARLAQFNSPDTSKCFLYVWLLFEGCGASPVCGASLNDTNHVIRTIELRIFQQCAQDVRSVLCHEGKNRVEAFL